MSLDADRARLLEILRTLSFERRKVILASGRESDFYIDCKRTALTAEGHVLIGRLMFDRVRKILPLVRGVGGLEDRVRGERWRALPLEQVRVAIVAADFVAVATTADRSDVDGTKRMLAELYNLFEKKTGLVLNKVLDPSVTAKKTEMQNKVKIDYQVPLLGMVPCFCEILRAEGNFIFVQDKPDHPFTKIVGEMARKIENNEVN